MVSNRATNQSQSYISDTPPQIQVDFIPTSDDEDCLVPAIVEEYNLYLNPHLFPLMFIQDPALYDTWGVYKAHPPYMHNVDQSMHNELKVPITAIRETSLYYALTVGAPPSG